MTKPIISVCWKDHTNELAAVYKSLLKNNFLVDCTISAEGQSLKAHRLVLSACSPYFNMLFHEETEKHPLVILVDASFETLKAVIDFVYQGEIQIPEENLETFLTLAQSLQIKGLNAFPKYYVKKNLLDKTSEIISHCPSEDYQDTCEDQNISVNKSNHENASQQHPLHSDGYLDVHKNSSVLFERRSVSCEKVQLGSMMTLPQEHRRPLESDVSIETEITVKHEPLHAVISETNEMLGNVKNDKPTSGDYMSEMEIQTSVFHEQDLKQYSGCKSSHGNIKSSVMIPPQFKHSKEYSDVDDKPEPLLPVIFVPKREHMDDTDSGEPMDDHDVPGNNVNEMGEQPIPACGGANFDQCSSAVDRPLELAASQNRGGQWLPTPESTTSGQRVPVSNAHKPLLICGECPATFASIQGLRYHQSRHTGERPYRCDECGKAFIQKITLVIHQRTHTGERPFGCDLCGMTFTRSGHLSTHKRTHTGERPYRCDVCGIAFAHSSTLSTHKRTHTGERPYRCDVCGNSFARVQHLVDHKRLHTGERPYRCNVCGNDFANARSLSYHKRKHTEKQT